jgi:hypothetical protein
MNTANRVAAAPIRYAEVEKSFRMSNYNHGYTVRRAAPGFDRIEHNGGNV